MRQDVVDGLLYCGDFFCIFIWNLAFELFFQSHYQLNGIQRIRTQIVDGLENALQSVKKLYTGTNTGKLMIRVKDV